MLELGHGYGPAVFDNHYDGYISACHDGRFRPREHSGDCFYYGDNPVDGGHDG